jgi:hypothetical protein
MKWRGSYRGGEIELEANTRDELDKQLDGIHPSKVESDNQKSTNTDLPALSGNLGCYEAIRQGLGSPWGRVEPRTMAELHQAFESNALFFGQGTLSGALTYLTKSGAIRRIDKGGKWAYILVANHD